MAWVSTFSTKWYHYIKFCACSQLALDLDVSACLADILFALIGPYTHTGHAFSAFKRLEQLFFDKCLLIAAIDVFLGLTGTL